MTDIELLEFAAKAAGYKKRFVHYLGWNPLIDDGDALRLAVKLGLGVSVPLGYKRTDVVAFSDSRINAIESHGSDPLAATRRAIVRAAAEIGKAQSAARIGRQIK